MKTAIKVPTRLSLMDTELDQVLGFLPNPEKWTFGNVDVLNEYFVKVERNAVSKHAENAISALNSDFKLEGINKQYSIRKPRHKLLHAEHKPALAFGRGTVGFHTDSVSGICLLTLLHVFSFDSDDYPEHLDNYGEFYQGKPCELRVGESVIFNDGVQHAWLCNGCWIFSLFPLVFKRG